MEQGAQVGFDDLVDPDEVVPAGNRAVFAAASRGALDRHQLGQGGRHLNARKTPHVVLPFDDRRQVEAEIGDVREGVTRIVRQGGQNGIDHLLKVGVDAFFLLGAQLAVIEYENAGVFQQGLQLGQQVTFGFFHQPLGFLADFGQLFGGRHPVR